MKKSKNENKVVTTVRLPQPLYEKLVEAAKNDLRSITHYVELVITRHLESLENKKE